MKIYLATTAPGNESQRERGMLDIPKRLLSFYHISKKQLEVEKVFEVIKNENIFRRSRSSNS